MTIKQIARWIRDMYGIYIKPCWVCDVRARLGLTKRQAWNRIDPKRPKFPCPDKRREDLIKLALRRFGYI